MQLVAWVDDRDDGKPYLWLVYQFAEPHDPPVGQERSVLVMSRTFAVPVCLQ